MSGHRCTAALADRSTPTRPHVTATGVRAVWVNGVLVATMEPRRALSPDASSGAGVLPDLPAAATLSIMEAAPPPPPSTREPFMTHPRIAQGAAAGKSGRTP